MKRQTWALAIAAVAATGALFSGAGALGSAMQTPLDTPTVEAPDDTGEFDQGILDRPTGCTVIGIGNSC